MRALFAALALGGLLSGMAAAADPDAPRGATEPQRALYLRYCGACHGPDGKGDGVAGTLMRPKPADLTQLAKQHGGKFPFYEVMKDIDGTNSVRAHGDPDMPVWGEIFRSESGWDMARRADVQGKLMLITDYLQSIQAK